MADRQGDSSRSAPGAEKKPPDEKPAGVAAQTQPAGGSKNYTIPRHTPERPTARGESDGARASRSRDEKSTDKQTAGQQQRSGAHPPQRLAGALAQAADPVQGSMQQYLSQSSLNVPFSQTPAATGTPFGFGGYPLTSGFPPQPSGPCTSTSVPTAPLSWRGGGGDDRLHRPTAQTESVETCETRDRVVNRERGSVPALVNICHSNRVRLTGARHERHERAAHRLNSK